MWLMMTLPLIQMKCLWQHARDPRRGVDLAHEDVTHLRLPSCGDLALGEVRAIGVKIIDLEVCEELKAVAKDGIVVTACRPQFGQHLRPHRLMTAMVLFLRPRNDPHQKGDALHLC